MRRSIVYAMFAAAAMAAGEGSFEREMLAAHNAVRATVKAGPLVWSDKLAVVAQDWANTLLSQRTLTHRPNSKFGENLYTLEGSKSTPEQVVQRWASEAANYDHKSNRCKGGACGHYTQIVWSNTKEVGCAVARSGNREVWVCEYNPPGNYIGQRPY